MNRALFIEASSALRSECSEYLQSRGIDTYAARTLADARALLPVLQPDVAALDSDLEDGDGLEMIQDIVDAGSRCLIISARDEARDRILALSRGADGYLVKPVNAEELYLRIRNILATRRSRNSEINNAIIDLHGIKVDVETSAVLDRGGAQGPQLTKTELALLRLLTENTDRAISKEILFRKVLGRTFSPGNRSLDVSVSRLRIKLKSADINAEILSIREVGYLFTREEPAPVRKAS
jgi:DNA-binding response OmpR family regulator